MLGPAELNCPVELRFWLMPVVYGFAAYGFTGLVSYFFDSNLFFNIEASIPEADRAYVKEQRATAAQKTKVGAGQVVLVIAFLFGGNRNPDVIVAGSAKHYAGQSKSVVGKVSQIKRIREGKVLVDFGDAYPKQNFTAVFTPEAYADVRREQGGIKVGDWVSVHGIIDLYGGCPEIRVYGEENVSVNPYSPDYSPN